MYWVLLFLFLVVLFFLSMRHEHMTTNPVMGPEGGGIDTTAQYKDQKSGTAEKVSTANLFGPTFTLPPPPPKPKSKKPCKHRRPGAHPRPQAHLQLEPEPEPRPIPEDDGTHASDTATGQYAIYFYKPFATLPFPTSPPPQPYLNDFKVFQH